MSAIPIRQRVLGKSPDQIATICRNLHHADLVGLVADLATLEPHFTDKEIAARRRIGYRKVQKLMRAGVIAPAHKAGRTNSFTAPLSAVIRFDKLTAIQALGGHYTTQ